MRKTRIIGQILIAFFLLPLITFAEAKDIKEYKVIKGDTLWDITKTKLNNPFLWSKVWKENPKIANPDLIYPDQIIKIPLHLLQKGEGEARLKPASESQETAMAAGQSNQGSQAGEARLKPASESQETAMAAGQRYKGIKGIVLYDGSVIEGEIIFMSADIVTIRTQDGKVTSYSFEQEVENFIKESE